MNISVDPLASSPAFHFFQGQALVVKHGLVDLKQGAILVEHKHMLRKEIYELPQLPLFLSKFRFSLLAILYVRPGCIPTNDWAVSIQQGVVANQEPAVATVFSASTLLVFKWNRTGQG